MKEAKIQLERAEAHPVAPEAGGEPQPSPGFTPSSRVDCMLTVLVAILFGIAHMLPHDRTVANLEEAMQARGQVLILDTMDVTCHFRTAAMTATFGPWTVKEQCAERDHPWGSSHSVLYLVLLPVSLLFMAGWGLNQIIILGSFIWPALCTGICLFFARSLRLTWPWRIAMTIFVITIPLNTFWHLLVVLLKWLGAPVQELSLGTVLWDFFGPGDLYFFRLLILRIPFVWLAGFLYFLWHTLEYPSSSRWIGGGILLGALASAYPFSWISACACVFLLFVEYYWRSDRARMLRLIQMTLLALPFWAFLLLRHYVVVWAVPEADVCAREITDMSYAQWFPAGFWITAAGAGLLVTALLILLRRSRDFANASAWSICFTWSAGTLISFYLLAGLGMIPATEHFLSRSLPIGLGLSLFLMAGWLHAHWPGRKLAWVGLLLCVLMLVRFGLLISSKTTEQQLIVQERPPTLAYMKALDWLRENTERDAVVGTLSALANDLYVPVFARKRCFALAKNYNNISYKEVFVRYDALSHVLQSRVDPIFLLDSWTWGNRGRQRARDAGLPEDLAKIIREHRSWDIYSVFDHRVTPKQSNAIASAFSDYYDHIRKRSLIEHNQETLASIQTRRLDYVIFSSLEGALGCRPNPEYMDVVFTNDAATICRFRQDAAIRYLLKATRTEEQPDRSGSEE